MRDPLLQLEHHEKCASSVETVGEFGLGKLAKHVMQGDPEALGEALQQLRNAIGRSSGFNFKDKDELVADIDKAEAELKSENPSKSRLLKWLGGVATAVQAIGSAQPAFEVVRAAARALGLPW